MVDNGLQGIYVNAAIDDNSNIAALMKVLSNGTTYDDRFPAISNQKRIYKTTEGGINIMCGVIKRNREEAAKNTTIQNLKNLMKNMKLTAKQAMDALGIPESEQSFYARSL